eukprot:g74503.t1
MCVQVVFQGVDSVSESNSEDEMIKALCLKKLGMSAGLGRRVGCIVFQCVPHVHSCLLMFLSTARVRSCSIPYRSCSSPIARVTPRSLVFLP